MLSIGLLLLSSCDNSEQEARKTFNQAIKDWNDGNIEAAERKFDKIESSYLGTVVATESIKERTRLKEQYKAEYDINKEKAKNRGIFSRTVITGIDKYHQSNNKFPDELSEISLQKNKDYLSLCEYQKSLFEYGYQLNCTKADSAFLDDRRKSIQQKRYTNKQSIKDQIKTLNDFPKANSTWAEKFNPSKEAPHSGFYAYYINTNNPAKVIAEETVDDVSINYAWDKFHHIHSQDFGAYWIGRINIPKKEVKTIAINQSWSKTRVIIDGHIVYEGGSNKELLLTLEQGNHLVEVEYINNWHTTEFSLTFIDKVQKYSLTEIKDQLAENILGDYEVFYTGVYESTNKDLSLVLNVGKTNKPIVLFLSSYSPVKWYISNPFMTNIRAIVYGSYSPGSTISGDIDKSTLLLPSLKRIGTYSSKQKCSCTGGSFHCSGSSMLSTKKAIEGLSEHSLAGFTGKYSAASLNVPQIIVNPQYLQDLEAHNQKIINLRESCRKQHNPDFENMFKQQ